MKKLLILLINFYQKVLSPDTGWVQKLHIFRGKTCGFYPTCSEYTKQAIGKYGALRGIAMGIKRISRCHPWQHDLYDPVK